MQSFLRNKNNPKLTEGLGHHDFFNATSSFCCCKKICNDRDTPKTNSPLIFSGGYLLEKEGDIVLLPSALEFEMLLEV